MSIEPPWRIPGRIRGMAFSLIFLASGSFEEPR
jgi:hypothetical protein